MGRNRVKNNLIVIYEKKMKETLIFVQLNVWNMLVYVQYFFYIQYLKRFTKADIVHDSLNDTVNVLGVESV